ncbi:MerR family transcriptional regulator [Bradyrhizobium oropedii]|uniref:MerR family transcriptional regulator n=1 Tax=Bradyrhizobium oropedii TaxID=1571201 RepID=UPI001E33739B|nr:MerR family transcriptional regulator [Bradyrhizobium oropedii]
MFSSIAALAMRLGTLLPLGKVRESNGDIDLGSLSSSLLICTHPNLKVNFNFKQQGEPSMKIGELARESGLAPSRIRFYEREGLIGSIDRGLNGYRQYSRETRQVLEIIVMAQQAGFSLDEIRNLLPPHGKGDWSKDKLVAALKKKVIELAALQRRLSETQAGLEAVIARIEATPPGGDCFENAEAVLADLRDQSKPVDEIGQFVPAKTVA